MNRIVHFEFHSSDPAKTQAFFESVFGWKFSYWQGPEDYWLIMTGENEKGIDGGMLKSKDGQPRTVNTVEVESVDEYVEKVTAAGGQVVVPKMAIPTVGWIAYCTEPTGNLFGVYKTDPQAK